MTDENIDEEIIEAVAKNQFVHFCGIKFVRESDGSYTGRLKLEEHHLNPYGRAHGGILYTIADTTGGINSRRYIHNPVTLDSDFHYLNNTGAGTEIVSTARIVRAGSRIAVLNVQVKTERGDLLCESTFTYYDVTKKT